jgi:hypothetical protein
MSNGSSQEKNLEGEKRFKTSAQYEDDRSGIFGVSALSQSQTPAPGVPRMQLLRW